MVDSIKYHYHQKKLIQLKGKLKNVGNHFHIEPSYSIVNPHYISIGESFYALYNNRIEAIDQFLDQSFTPEIIIGKNVSINTDCHIGCIDKIVIGDNVMIASRVFITDHFHGDSTLQFWHLKPREKPLTSKGPVFISEGVWLGEGVVVLPGVTIGKNSVIGANSVVTKSIPANVIAGGIPCKVIKEVVLTKNDD